MKRILQILTFVSFGIFQANAQCTIAPTCIVDPSTGYCSTPDPATPLPNGEVGVAYTTNIQLSIAADASGNPITDVQITNIILPAGLNYTTSPANGIIIGGESGCVEITGMPTTAATGGTIGGIVTIQVIANTGAGPIPVDVDYTITIDEGTASLTEVASPNLFSLFPNPAMSDLMVNVIKPMEIEIFDVLGTKVISESITTSKTINILNLNSGVYFVIDKTTGTTQKLIKH